MAPKKLHLDTPANGTRPTREPTVESSMENLSVNNDEDLEYFEDLGSLNIESRNFYVVYKGRQTGIFDNWGLVSRHTDRFSGASFRLFATLEAAQESWRAYIEGCYQQNQSPATPTRTLIDRAPPSALANRTRAGSVAPSPMPENRARASSVAPVQANRVQLGAIAPSLAADTSRPTVRPARASDEESSNLYWVLLQGERPGVYHNMADARAAIGSSPVMDLRCLRGQAAADRLFVEKYMAGKVHSHI